jgi:hypothetical protein
MTYLHPAADSIHAYDPPHENVLLVTCMDLRLLDNIVDFMNHDNLCNRYDHIVFAGAALGAMGAPDGKDEHGHPDERPHWHKTFENHLGAAVELHSVKDVYILEHRGCGAYSKVFHLLKEGDSPEVELACHADYAARLEAFIIGWSKTKKWPLRIHKFMMDLRGDVTLLPDPFGTAPPPRRRQRKKGKRRP